jgi:hypothetical protein
LNKLGSELKRLIDIDGYESFGVEINQMSLEIIMKSAAIELVEKKAEIS